MQMRANRENLKTPPECLSLLPVTYAPLLLPHQGVASAPTTHTPTTPCSLWVSDPVFGLNISLTIRTPGRGCSFTLTLPDEGGDTIECTSKGGGEEGGRREESSDIRAGGEEDEVARAKTGARGKDSEEGEEVFTCVLDHLEAGTSHLLHIKSKTDEEAANVTLHTSESCGLPQP